jgi:hypothetical protein
MADYALPVPYSILPGPELRRLAAAGTRIELRHAVMARAGESPGSP